LFVAGRLLAAASLSVIIIIIIIIMTHSRRMRLQFTELKSKILQI